MNMMWFVIVVLGIIIILLLWVGVSYNSLVGMRNKVNNSWSQIAVQLKRRFDLIPNLVETVKGYATHERETLNAVTEARTKYMSATTPQDMMNANHEMTQVLGRLFAVSEAYPDLKANVNFLELQAELSKTEDKISFSRQFYNDVVMEFNNAVQMFPTNILAGVFNFKGAVFFQTEEAENAVPQVKF